MPFIGNQPALSYTSFAKQDFTTSATTSYTLDHPVTNENEIALFINFVRQEPTTAYTATNTTLTLTSATSATDDMYCVFLGKAVQTVNPPVGSVGASQISDGSIALGKLSATGTKDATTFLRGDNTFASAGGVNTPAFEAKDETTQTMSDETWTKLDVASENFDTNNNYDNSTMRFTPSVAGKYFFYAKSDLDASGYLDMRSADISFYKNGSRQIYTNSRFFQGGNTSAGGTVATPFVSAIFTLNGSTDYVEVYAKINALDNSDVYAMNTIFGGYKIIE